MRITGIFLVLIGIFFAIMGIAYWFLSYEDSGFLMLIGSTGLGVFPGLYYLWWSRHMKPRAEDDPNASVAAAAGIVDSFPVSSIWPFIFGMGAMLATLTFVFGLWLAPMSATLILIAAIGFTVESRRGGNV